MTPQIDMILSQRKRDIIAEIKSLVRPDGKSKTAALLSEYEQVTHLEKASQASPDATRYVAVGKPIAAIIRFLEDEGEPRTREQIITGVLAGGWRGGKRENMQSLYVSIGVFTAPHGRGTNARNAPLRMIGDRIGLKVWELERWAVEEADPAPKLASNG